MAKKSTKETTTTKELKRFEADRHKFFIENCDYIRISKKDAQQRLKLTDMVLARMNNLNYNSYTLFLGQFLNTENKLVSMDCTKKVKLQKEDIVERLMDRFDISERTADNYLSAAKKANVLIKVKGDDLTKEVFIMNPVAYNGSLGSFFAELMFYFSDDLIKLLSPYQYLACAKIVNVDYPKVNECKYLFTINKTRYNVEKIMNGEFFEVPNAFKAPEKMSWTKAKEFVERRGISEIIGLPVSTKFNCIFHNDEKELGLVIFRDGKERYYCLNDECISGPNRVGQDIFNLLYILMGIEEDTDNQFRIAMEYLASLYNIEIEETVAEQFRKASSEKDKED